MTRRKVLLVAYYFPPLGGAGVGRPLALMRGLASRGYECHVLTVKPVTYRVYERSLLEGIDQSVIYRSGSFDPQRLMYLLGARKVKSTSIEKARAIADRFFPDSKIGWVRKATRFGTTLATNKRYDAIISTSPPVSAHLVARTLARQFDLPWIADFRDYWTAFKPEDWYSSQHSIDRAHSLLYTIEKEAAVVTSANKSIADYVDAATVIPNSYDSQLAQQWQPLEQNDRFTIGLFGTFNKFYPVEPLLKVLARIRDNSPDLFGKISLLQAGDVSHKWLFDNLETYNMTGICDCRGYVPRIDVNNVLSGCALFYLGLPFDNEKGITTARIFNLLASGRPLLAAVPSVSEIAALIDGAGCGFCFDDSSLSEAADYTAKLTQRYLAGELDIAVLPEYALKYSSEKMVDQFADLLDRIISEEPSS